MNLKLNSNVVKFEESVGYCDLLSYIEQDDQKQFLWHFKQITAHEGASDSKLSQPEYFDLMRENELSAETLHINVAISAAECATFAQGINTSDQYKWSIIDKMSQIYNWDFWKIKKWFGAIFSWVSSNIQQQINFAACVAES